MDPRNADHSGLKLAPDVARTTIALGSRLKIFQMLNWAALYLSGCHVNVDPCSVIGCKRTNLLRILTTLSGNKCSHFLVL